MNLRRTRKGSQHIVSIAFFFISLLLGLACDLVHGEGTNAGPDLSMYAQSEVFKEAMILHTNATWNLQQTNILVMSVFLAPAVVQQIYVNQAGAKRERTWWTFNLRGDGNAAFNATQLPEEKIQSLRAAINEIPTQNESPPIGRLVIVSFPNGPNWITRCYDSGALPKPMRRMGDLLGVTFETKARPQKGF